MEQVAVMSDHCNFMSLIGHFDIYSKAKGLSLHKGVKRLYSELGGLE